MSRLPNTTDTTDTTTKADGASLESDTKADGASLESELNEILIKQLNEAVSRTDAQMNARAGTLNSSPPVLCWRASAPLWLPSSS
ncbi:MAG: hypothetical protein IPK63_19210 [Candidatus Competibacteraceae bacterium]|nr:hypothetical protein [Candidatus Competibacteraceae bacterium]